MAEYTRREKLCLMAKPGAHVCDVVREAIIVALTDQCDVEVSHNDKKTMIVWTKIVNTHLDNTHLETMK